MRISDWSSDVCSSDLLGNRPLQVTVGKSMASTYKIISSDSHVIEPWFLWRERLPKKFRDRAPRLVQGEDGDKLVCEDVEIPPIGKAAGGFGGPGQVRQTGAREEDITPSDYDPDARVKERDRETNGEIG